MYISIERFVLGRPVFAIAYIGTRFIYVSPRGECVHAIRGTNQRPHEVDSCGCRRTGERDTIRWRHLHNSVIHYSNNVVCPLFSSV